jgi:phage major head subunit gpT-like protein
MAIPHLSTNFGDLLDPRFQRIFHEEYDDIPVMLAELFSMVPTNGRNNMTFSQVGTLDDWTEFTGTVDYDSQTQGYDTTITPIVFNKGIQVERELNDDDQHNIINGRPKAMARSATRTREKHAASIWNGAFSVAPKFYVNSENVAMCSNSHTTNAPASTASGFDNLGTAALSATAVTANFVAMQGFRGDRAELIDINPDCLLYPVNLYEIAYEILNANGKVDTDLNNPNVHHGQYKGIRWNRLTDINNWFMEDQSLRKEMVHWTDRVPMEFAMAEDFDKFIAKWRGYMRYAFGHTDWRHVFGNQVS